jgi:hypothetical protein
MDQVGLVGELAGRGHALAQAPDLEAAVDRDHRDRQARVDPALDFAHVRQRRWARLCGAGGVIAEHGGGEPSAGAQVAADRGQRGSSSRRSPEDLKQLHRCDHRPEPALERQRASVGAHRLDREPALGGAVAKLVE